MATAGRSRLLPQCTECMRMYAFGNRPEARPALGSIQHVRGKKKSTRGPPTIPVRLLKDVAGFGRQGAIVPVSPGQMRNKFFSKGQAEYITGAELHTLRHSNTILERDSTFGIKKPVVAADVEDETPFPEAGRPEQPLVLSITPQRSIELVELFVPASLNFYRETIPETEQEQEEELHKEPIGLSSDGGSDLDTFEIHAETAKEALEAQQQARLQEKKNAPRAIYGSVSTQDVLRAMKAVLAEGSDEAARVVINESDLTFVTIGNQDDSTRVKQTGSYGLNIRLKGTSGDINRIINVLAQDS